jgi:hypothetical protein
MPLHIFTQEPDPELDLIFRGIKQKVFHKGALIKPSYEPFVLGHTYDWISETETKARPCFRGCSICQPVAALAIGA